MRLVIVPRWSGDAGCDWVPWLRASLGDRVSGSAVARLLPAPGAPEIAPTVAEVRELLGDDPGDVLLVGHSVGAQAAMRALATLPAGRGVASLVLVAGWFTVDRPWDSIRPWIEAPVDYAAARSAAVRRVVLLGDDDPFTADFAATRRAFEARLAADVRVVAGARHFNRAEEPEVLRACASVV